MTVEIGSNKPRAIDFTFNGNALAVRKLPLSLGLKLQSAPEDGIPAELVAEIISKCVVDGDGNKVWTPDDVLDFDLDPMLQLFSEISESVVRVEEAEKN